MSSCLTRSSSIASPPLFFQALLIILLLLFHLYLPQNIPCLIPQSYSLKLQKDIES
jgi:hypothetical protein